MKLENDQKFIETERESLSKSKKLGNELLHNEREQLMKSISDHETKMNERIKENNTKHEEMQNRINILLHRKFVLEQEIKETLRHQETLSADIESESRMIA